MLPSYSYSPQKLMDAFHALEAKEEESRNDNASEDTVARVDKTTTKHSNSITPPFVVAAVQLTAGGLPDHSVEGFWERAQEAVRIAVQDKGANLILLPELFIGPYFCQSQEACLQKLAMELPSDTTSNFLIARMQVLAKTYQVVLPISIYERKNNALYNSVVMIDADGTLLGTYRKSHIPDGTGYQEKFYFTPGDSGFRVWDTKVGKVGLAICWDQWFPEAARAMALQGADVLLYPTAIGSEPQDPSINSADHWQRVMQGHSGANMIPVVASNRYGTEILLHEDGSEKQRITFYGRSFITDATGAKVAEASMESDQPICILTSTVDPEANRSMRLAWGLFRDRRPDLYGILQTKDGSIP